MFQVNNKDARTTPMVKHTQKICQQIADELFWVFLTNGVVLVSLLLPLNTFHTLF